jgi:hypothetical protein
MHPDLIIYDEVQSDALQVNIIICGKDELHQCSQLFGEEAGKDTRWYCCWSEEPLRRLCGYTHQPDAIYPRNGTYFLDPRLQPLTTSGQLPDMASVLHLGVRTNTPE